jgi:hypothetical protein
MGASSERTRTSPCSPQLASCAAPEEGPARPAPRRDSQAALPLGTRGRGGAARAARARREHGHRPAGARLRRSVWRRDAHLREGCARCRGLTSRPGRAREGLRVYCACNRARIVCPEPGGALNLWAGRGVEIPFNPPPPPPTNPSLVWVDEGGPHLLSAPSPSG